MPDNENDNPIVQYVYADWMHGMDEEELKERRTRVVAEVYTPGEDEDPTDILNWGIVISIRQGSHEIRITTDDQITNLIQALKNIADDEPKILPEIDDESITCILEDGWQEKYEALKQLSEKDWEDHDC